MSVTIKLDGVEVAVVSPGSGPTVINLSLPGRDKSALRIGQVIVGVVCLIFCWTSPYLFTGVWTGIPFIVTASLFVAHDRTSHPNLLVAALLMNFVSFVLAIAGVSLFNYRYQYNHLEYFVLFANLYGIYICLQSFCWPAAFPLKKVEQDAQSLLDPLPPVYEEKSPYLDKVEQDAQSLLGPLPPVYEEKSPYLDKV